MPITNTAIRKAPIGVALALASTLGLAAQTTSGVMWGNARAGLRIGIAAVPATVSSERARFELSFSNVGNSDFVLNLGSMLANGRVMFPDAVRIGLTSPDGTSREFKFFDRRYPGVAGRIDDFIVALRAGATYLLPVTLDQFWNAEAGIYGVRLKPGRNRISARFEGRGAAHPNLDTPGIKLLNFWTGSVESAETQFVIP